MLQNALASLLHDTITHEPAIGYSGAGKPIYGPPVTHAARVARKQRTVIGKSGVVAVSRSQIWFAASVPVGFSDRVTLPDGTSPPVLAVDTLPDDSGTLYTKVYV